MKTTILIDKEEIFRILQDYLEESKKITTNTGKMKANLHFDDNGGTEFLGVLIETEL